MGSFSKQVHGNPPGPTFNGSGSISVYRSGSKVYATGSLTIRFPYSWHYGYPYYGVIRWNGIDKHTITVKDTNPERGSAGATFTASFNNVEIADDNGAGTVSFWGHCGQGGGCTGSWNYIELSSEAVSAGYHDTTINITGPTSNSLHRHDQNMTVSWDAWGSDGTNSTTYVDINGRRNNANSGNSAGSVTFKPSDYGVSDGKSFTVTAYRAHQTGRNTASSSRTFRTYTVPTVSNIKMNPNPVSANINTTVSWDGNNPAFSDETINSSLSINGSSYISTGTTKSWTGTMRNYVPVSKDNQNVTIKVRRTNSGSGVYSESSFTTAKVLYTPTKPVTNLIFKKNSSTGATIPVGSTIDKAEVTNIYNSWSAPTGNDRGVISGYRVVIESASGEINTYFTSSTNILIPVSDLTACQSHTITVTPYYLESGRYYYGPALSSDYVLPMSRINTPSITYPANNSSWLNPGYRILTTLPTDPDFSSLPSDVQKGYKYMDIELNINGTSILWSDYPEVFSLDVLSYNSKIIMNPTLSKLYPNSGTKWTIKYRVRKNYGDTDSSIAWSNWSSTITVNYTARTFNVEVGDKILASHYNGLVTTINRMRTAYPVFTMSSTNVTAGVTKIQRGDYTKTYNDIRSIVNYVNSFGDFDSDRQNVKFPELPTFTPLIEEITAHEIANYIRKMYNFANSLCNINLAENVVMEQGSLDYNTGEEISSTSTIRCNDYIEVIPEAVYRFYRCGTINTGDIGFRQYNSNKELVNAGNGNIASGSFHNTFACNSQTKYVRFIDQNADLKNKYLLMMVRNA